jgi:membrane associated rhomboid family serine protease
VFGDNIEDSMGHLRFISFYLICGILATLTHSMIESNSSSPLIGASGAISGVLGAYIVIHPKARILVLFMNIIPLRLPAIIVLGSWIGIQFVSLGNGTNTAWWAHIGGFAAGMALIIPFRKNQIVLPNKWKIINKGKSIIPPHKTAKTGPSIFPKSLKK